MPVKTIEVNSDKGFQTINIPKDLRINDDKVYLKKVGNTLIVIPFHDPWRNLIEAVDLFTDDFMNERHQPDHQPRELFG
jgi:antitoxin VapB